MLALSLIVLPVAAQHYNLLIGTYTNTGKSKGIYTYNINMESGVFAEKSVAVGVSNPSFLAISPDRKHVYAVSESNEASAAKSFEFDENEGTLTMLNSSLTKGSGPCYILATDNHVFTANYGGGSVSVFGRKPDGSLTDVQQVLQHTGKSIDPKRQNEPHAHQVMITPDSSHIIANDLGTDKMMVYSYNPDNAENALEPVDSLAMKPGSGPRHATFSKDGRLLYVLHELDGTVSVVEMKGGRLRLLQETSLVRKKNITTGAADIHLSPDGHFLYATNRGTANDITCFAVGNDGKLTFRQQVPTEGDGPRNFAITPDGNYLFVGHQKTDNIVIFKRDIKTGRLTNTGQQIKVGSPVCLLFY